jgi:hypothetical protein
MLPYPPDGGLKKPVRDFKDTFSVWTVLKEEFFPGLLTDKEKQQIGPERAAVADSRAKRQST